VEPSSVAAFPTKKLVQANAGVKVATKAIRKRALFIIIFLVFLFDGRKDKTIWLNKKKPKVKRH